MVPPRFCTWTPCFLLRPVFSTKTPCFPPDPVFSTPCVFHTPWPRTPYPGTPAPRFPPSLSADSGTLENLYWSLTYIDLFTSRWVTNWDCEQIDIGRSHIVWFLYMWWVTMVLIYTHIYYIHTEIYTLKSRRVNFRSQADVNQSNVAYRFSHMWEKRYVQSGAAYHVFSRLSRTASGSWSLHSRLVGAVSYTAQAIALRVWKEQIVFIRISSIVDIESSCLGESQEWKVFRYPRFFGRRVRRKSWSKFWILFELFCFLRSCFLSAIVV